MLDSSQIFLNKLWSGIFFQICIICLLIINSISINSAFDRSERKGGIWDYTKFSCVIKCDAYCYNSLR